MQNSIVRVRRVRIENLRNVECGEVTLSNNRRTDGASVLGIYGQNGSGKSTLVDTFEVIQRCVAGHGLPRQWADLVNVEAESGLVECEFSINCPDEDEHYTVVYAFCLRREDELPSGFDDEVTGAHEQSMGAYVDEPKRRLLRVYGEVLKVRAEGPDRRMRLTTLIDTTDGTPFNDAAKQKALIGGSADDAVELTVELRLAYRESRSFVFSQTFHRLLRENWNREGKKEGSKVDTTLKVLSHLRRFSQVGLFVLNTRDSGMPALGALPYPFRYGTEQGHVVGAAMLSMEGASVIPQKVYDAVVPAMENTNIVLRQLVPGLMIGIEVLGDRLMRDGVEGKSVQLVSRRDGRVIPLSSESEGIKRIISFLNLLILMYNDPSVTVVIDEIDAGVFEYLLGELLCIVAEHGRGQLVFTSHNLRPLETLDRGFIVFTTTNPKNRYWRMTGVKPSNNLRDFYYRDIMLGGQSESLYDSTSNGDIEFAFMEAGES